MTYSYNFTIYRFILLDGNARNWKYREGNACIQLELVIVKMTLNSINVHRLLKRIIGIGECVVRWYDRKNIRYVNNTIYHIKIIWNFRLSTKMKFTCFINMIYHELDLQFKENSSDQAYFCYEVEHQDFVIL